MSDQETRNISDQTKIDEPLRTENRKTSTENFTAEEQAQPTERFITWSSEEPKEVLLAAKPGETLEEFSARTRQYQEELERRKDGQPDTNTFCIDGFEDGTVVTAAGKQKSIDKAEPPALFPEVAFQSVSIEPNPSYVEGLKAIGDDEETQGLYSIQYIERKGQEALASAQNPKTAQEPTDLIIQSDMIPKMVADTTSVTISNSENDGTLLAEKLFSVLSKDARYSIERFRQSLNYQNDVALHLKEYIRSPEQPRPKDGDDIKFSEFLTQYKSVIGDAYEMSRQLPDGTPGKSKTLEKLIDDLRNCPWAKDIRVRFDANIKHPEYLPESSTIVLNPNDPPIKQLQNFAHEAYHATHQMMTKLYSPTGILSTADYADIKGEVEARCFESEVEVTNELRELIPNLSGPKYKWVDAQGKAQLDMDLCDLYEKQGYKGLKDFLLDRAFTRMNTPTGDEDFMTYRQFYATTSYLQYQAVYPRGVELTERYLQTSPDIVNY